MSRPPAPRLQFLGSSWLPWLPGALENCYFYPNLLWLVLPPGEGGSFERWTDLSCVFVPMEMTPEGKKGW